VKTQTWHKHFEGWQAGALAVFVAWMVALVVVPTSAPPDGLPLPRVTPREGEAARQRARADAVRAEQEPLPFAVRLLGARVRRYGAAERARDEQALSRATQELAASATEAFKADPNAVVLLRAYQRERFLAAMESWLSSGHESTDLVELGGGVTQLMIANGWVSVEASPGHRTAVRRLSLDDLALRSLFDLRFSSLVGDHPVLFPDPVEERALYAFLLAHPPERPRSVPEGVPLWGDAYVLAKLEEVPRVDPSYPLDYARGVVLYRMGRYESAARSFSAYVESHESGPYTLRAINHLKASLERIDGEP
jgi:hypothetical protein